MQQQAAGAFAGDVPGTPDRCDIEADAGRFVSISPSTTPGLPAPLAWTLSRLATADLNQQRMTALEKASAESIGKWATSGVVCQ